jgi:homocysteine S-methyltransferase
MNSSTPTTAILCCACIRPLKTNTFGANRQQLEGYGLAERVTELNTAGVQLAREAASAADHQAPPLVLASIGPTPGITEDTAAITDCYAEQVAALIAAQPDALLLETFGSLAQLTALIALIQRHEHAPPIITEIAFECDPDGGSNIAPTDFLDAVADCGVAVAGVNCCAPWDARTFVDRAETHPAVARGDLLLAAMPNAGGFQRIGNRFMTSVNPEFMGRLAREFGDRGVRLIGGCCEVNPPNIREMYGYLRSRRSGSVVSAAAPAAHSPAGPAEKRQNGRFSEKLFNDEFVVSVEQLPPRGTAPSVIERKLAFAGELADSGLVDALDITDGSRGIPLMPPWAFAERIRQRLDAPGALELIPHFTARDLNAMGIQSRLIGYHATGIHNVLFITGDPPKMSPTYPASTAVFDADSVEMLRLAHQNLNAGVDFGGRPLGRHADPRTHFTLGTGFEPEAVDSARELARLEAKLAAGCDYLMTQPAFRREPLAVLDPYRARVRVLVGVMILTGLEYAERMARVPGVTVPDAVFARLRAFSDPADQAKAAIELAADQVRWVKESGWAGVYVMSPASTRPILDVLRAGLG